MRNYFGKKLPTIINKFFVNAFHLGFIFLVNFISISYKDLPYFEKNILLNTIK